MLAKRKYWNWRKKHVSPQPLYSTKVSFIFDEAHFFLPSELYSQSVFLLWFWNVFNFWIIRVLIVFCDWWINRYLVMFVCVCVKRIARCKHTRQLSIKRCPLFSHPFTSYWFWVSFSSSSIFLFDSPKRKWNENFNFKWHFNRMKMYDLNLNININFNTQILDCLYQYVYSRFD